MSGCHFSKNALLGFDKRRFPCLADCIWAYALLFFIASAAGQTQPCEVDVPLNIVMPDAALVRNVPQDVSPLIAE